MRSNTAKTVALFVAGTFTGGCGATANETPEKGGTQAATEGTSQPDRPASCPALAEAPAPLPRVDSEHQKLSYWLERVAARQGDLDEVLMGRERIRDHNRAFGPPDPDRDDEAVGQRDLGAPVEADKLRAEVHERLAFMHDRVNSGTYVDDDGDPIEGEALQRFAPVEELPELDPTLHVALEPVPLRCGPDTRTLHKADATLDLDRNNCSTAHPQEAVQVLATWPNGMRLARTAYSLGWIAAEAALSPAVPGSVREIVASGSRAQARRELELRARDGDARASVPPRTMLPLAGGGGEDADTYRVHFATREGVHTSEPVPASALEPAPRPLTRRAVLEEAFALRGTPYGWGGEDGGRDCSRFVLDVMSTFGLEMPRHSALQADAGSWSIDVAEVDADQKKRLLIQEAARKGVVLLHFPGHIMFYLGRTKQGRMMAIHSFAEYVTPCEDTKGPDGKPLETLHRVDDIRVSDLELGRGSSRGAFIERITRITVLGKPPGVELGGVARTRPTAPPPVPDPRDCDDSLHAAVFESPKWAHTGTPLRVIATLSEDPRPVRLALVGPEGERVEPDQVTQLGGPPWTWWAQVDDPAVGRWTALLADGHRVEACDRMVVHRGPRPEKHARQHDASKTASRAKRASGTKEASGTSSGTDKEEQGRPPWEPKWKWEEDTENLYAAFIEQLFEQPTDKDLTWPRLQRVLSNPDRNLLYNHLGHDEDEKLRLEPDCADLPYFLRAYFAWKIRLPFAFRRCSRGQEDFAPVCGEELHTSLDPVEAEGPVKAFHEFARRLKSGVHSGSARTAPDAEHTDLYPVALNRRALRPGTVYADPHGHLLVVADWRPQGIEDYGVLLAADAQPDGTVGRRRFWRGSFLFTPDTSSVGAGFKRWRPLVYDEEKGKIEALDNAALRETNTHVPYSEAQYQGSRRDFYDQVRALINPRALDPKAMQVALVDALEEAVNRRVTSVENAVEFMEERDWAPIEMPRGYDIFETSGAWENYSTPARDMRLLISIDAVVDFADRVARTPERFGVDEDEVEPTLERVKKVLDEELQKRTFTYTRSDGSTWKLTLKDVVDRADAFEMGYHPNDCVEIRWAAPKGSKERSTCNRHAPDRHRARMRRYRPWFEQRQRPPRGTERVAQQ